jgi:hypothetical protein
VAPAARAFLDLNLCAPGDALHDSGIAGRPGAHRDGSAGHCKFCERRGRKGYDDAKPEKKTPDHSAGYSVHDHATLARIVFLEKTKLASL